MYRHHIFAENIDILKPHCSVGVIGLSFAQVHKSVSVANSLEKTTNDDEPQLSYIVGPISKKTRNMVRLIARQAQAEGIDCRTGKYTVHFNKEKYDASSLDELPPPLHPSNVKQIRIDNDTIAYQSEFAPFSNMFPVCITIGQYKFISLEQAYQFLRAKKMNKLLAATKIYLSRDQVEIKQLGDDLGTTDAWEAEKFDIMYICLKRKF